MSYARDASSLVCPLAGNGLSEVVSIPFSFLRSDLVVAPWNLSLAAWNTEPETTVGCARP